MRKNFIGLNIFLILLYIGCGSGEITDTTSTNDIEIQTKQTLMDESQKKIFLEISIQNNYTDGVVTKLSDISLDLNACTISSLEIEQDEVELSKPLESKTVFFKADLIKPCMPVSYKIKANTLLTYNGTSKKNIYMSDSYPIAIDENTTIEDTISIFDYEIKLEATDNDAKIGLGSKKRYKLSLVNSSSNRDVEEYRVHSFSIESSDPSKVKLIDPNNYAIDQGTPHDKLSFVNKNNIDLYIQTYTTSGIADFKVDVNYTNNRNEVHNLTKKVSVLILSGEPMAFSINDLGVTYDFDTKWFTETFLISASDKYNNTVNTSPRISVSAMADFTRDENGKRILYGKFGTTKARLIADKESHSASLFNDTNLFGSVDNDRDFLFLFGDVPMSEALGKWDIDPYNDSESTLALTDLYYGDSYDELGFAIGHSYYKEICSSESKEWELNIDSTDGTYQLDEDGKAVVTLKFPAYMIGKKIALGVNFSGKDKRAGEVHFQTLYSFDGIIAPDTITIDSNSTTARSFSHYFEVNTGTTDRFWLKNARVVCNMKTNNVIVTNFVENREVNSIADCGGYENGEVAYWKMVVSLADLSKSGSVEFEDCQVSSFIGSF